jgi:hypothetical protein
MELDREQLIWNAHYKKIIVSKKFGKIIVAKDYGIWGKQLKVERVIKLKLS